MNRDRLFAQGSESDEPESDVPAEVEDVGGRGPEEVSSKKRPPRFRRIVQVPRRKVRDPRFEAGASSSSENAQAAAAARYSFLVPMLEEELKDVTKQLKRVKSKVTREELKERRRTLKAQLATRKRDQARRDALSAVRKKQAEGVLTGRKRFHLKGRKLREEVLKEEFNQLKAAGGEAAVRRAIKKKRRKDAQKDKRRMGRALDG